MVRRLFVIALAIFLITMLYGCRKQPANISLADEIAYENLAKIDVELAESMKKDVSYEEDFSRKIVPIAEHVAILKALWQTPWNDIDNDASAQAETLVLTNNDNSNEKLVVVYSKETKSTHLFIMRKEEQNIVLEAHTILSLAVTSPRHSCYIGGNGGIYGLDSRESAADSVVPDDLIGKTFVVRTFLREKSSSLPDADTLSKKIRSTVRVYGDKNKKLFLIKEGNVYSLLSSVFRRSSSTINFIGFFESGYAF